MLSSSNRAIPDLVAAMRQESTRWDAIVELRNRSDATLGPELVPFYNDPEWVIRWIVCEKWGDLGYTDAVPLLVSRLSDRDFHVRKNAAKALIKLGLTAVPPVTPLLASLKPELRQFADEIIIEIGDPGVPHLAEICPQSDWVIANRIVDILWRIGTPLATTAIVNNLSNPLVQKHAIVALGDLGNCDVIPHLLIYMNHPKLKRFIVTALHYLNPDKSYPILIKFLDDPLFTDQSRQALIRIGKAAIPYIERALKFSPGSAVLTATLKAIQANTNS